ncbi:MAG: hypothetical protein AMXMBFR84_05580 [Candidatus Hydrogenedentota bacterium]
MVDFVVHITGIAGPIKGRTWPLSKKPLLVGRLQTCDICIQHRAVSRRHCEISVVNGEIKVMDLHSSNTTLVNGEPVSEKSLSIGDQIAVGPAVLLITSTSDSQPTDLNGDDNLSSTLSLSEKDVSYLRQTPTEIALMGRPQTVQDLAALYSIGRRFSTATDLKSLLEIMLKALHDRFEPRACWVARQYRMGEDLNFISLPPVPEGQTARLKPPIKLMTRSLQDHQAIRSPEKEGTYFVAPIQSSGATTGVVALLCDPQQRKVGTADLEFLLALANQAAPFIISVEHAERMQRDLERLRASNTNATLIGKNRVMENVRRLLLEAAQTNLNVLILGETGTGKELAAQMIHEQSTRSEGPFITINCAAIPHELFESELFGYKKGVFTGANTDKIGRFEQAHLGTLFLDEVGDLSMSNQARLLRVIETGTFHRLGAEEETHVDVRVVAATNMELNKAAVQGRFRQDLLHRLNGFQVTMPALRERLSDIPVLAEYFLEHSRERAKRPISGFSTEAIETLSKREWLGNVRELKSTIERAVATCRTEQIEPADLVSYSESGALEIALGQPVPLADIEKRHIECVIRDNDGNMSAAARVLGISRATLYNKVREYGISI